MHWLNEPSEWSVSGNRIIVKTSPQTDFWRVTHYGFIRDNGHFYFEQIDGDFVVQVKLRGRYQDLYDQAGIMVRTDECHWIKTGIEYVGEVQNLSAVVTLDYSDWSVIPLMSPPEVVQLRLERRKEAVEISYLDENSQYRMLRLAYFPVDQTVQVGVMCASPQGNGYEIEFEDYQLSR